MNAEYAEAYYMLTGRPYPAHRPGVSVLPITQDEARDLATVLELARRYSTPAHHSRRVLDRAVEVLKCAVTLTDVAPFAAKEET